MGHLTMGEALDRALMEGPPPTPKIAEMDRALAILRDTNVPVQEVPEEERGLWRCLCQLVKRDLPRPNKELADIWAARGDFLVFARAGESFGKQYYCYFAVVAEAPQDLPEQKKWLRSYVGCLGEARALITYPRIQAPPEEVRRSLKI